jgi:hypothetical protein
MFSFFGKNFVFRKVFDYVNKFLRTQRDLHLKYMQKKDCIKPIFLTKFSFRATYRKRLYDFSEIKEYEKEHLRFN